MASRPTRFRTRTVVTCDAIDMSETTDRPSKAPLTRDEWSLVQRVVTDLDHIRDTWLWTMSEAEVRRESVTARRLLTDQEYLRAWQLVGLGGQPLVRATSFDIYVQGIERRWIMWGFAPPQSRILSPQNSKVQLQYKITRTLPVGSRLAVVIGYEEGGGPLVIQVPPDEYDPETEEPIVQPNIAAFDSLGTDSVYQTWTVDNFLRSTAALLEGTSVPRAEIIKYCANRLGGAHGGGRPGSPARAAMWAKLDLLYALLPTDLHAIWTELISIGRFVANSPDVDRLRETFRRMPEPAGPFSKSD